MIYQRLVIGYLKKQKLFSHNYQINWIVTAFQAASGWVNLITPTSAVIMGALAIARVDISKWWKWISKLMVILFVVTCIYLGILAIL